MTGLDGVIAATFEHDGVRVLAVMPEVPDDAPPAVREGIARRNIVNNGGTCPCGARMVLPSRAERRRAKKQRRPVPVNVEHEHGCPAATEAIVAAMGWSR